MQQRVTRRLLGLVFVPVGLVGVVLALYDFGRYLFTGDSLLTDVGKDLVLFNYVVSIFFLFGAGAALAGVGWILLRGRSLR